MFNLGVENRRLRVHKLQMRHIILLQMWRRVYQRSVSQARCMEEIVINPEIDETTKVDYTFGYTK